jgi:hypothetical protein
MSKPNRNGVKTADRGFNGRFVRGNTASPGRPPGRGAVAELRDKLAQDMDKIIEVLRAKALADDPQGHACRPGPGAAKLRPIELPAALDMPERRGSDLVKFPNSFRQFPPVRQNSARGD